MVREMLFMTVGGLGLFLFGMGLMSDGLKKVAGQKLRKLLESITKKPVVAVMVGALITCMIQSSSATTVMTVGFVNAGLLTLKQALCVVLGANIGTTFTAWLVSLIGTGLKITAYAMPAVAVGFLLQIVAKRQKWRSFGTILLGFGILFIGIGFMKDAFGPIKSSEQVKDILIWIGDRPLLAVLAGTIITIMVQSSSASIMIIQVLAFQGAFGAEWETVLRIAIPFILGDNIGTTITAQIAALRTSRNGKRTAWGHTIFNVLGVCYILPIVWMGWFGDGVIWLAHHIKISALSNTTIMLYIALAHSAFNIVNTIIFVPLIPLLEKVVLRILPVREDEADEKPVVLEEHLLHTPEIALDQSKRAILEMSKRARKAFRQAMEGLIDNDSKKLAKASKNEELIDDYQEQITSYLVELSRKQLSDMVSTELPVLLHSVNDLERVGDHAQNIVEIAERKIEHKIVFSDFAVTEMSQMVSEVYQMFDSVVIALEARDGKTREMAEKALQNEKNINKMQIDFRRSHVKRMSSGSCNAQTGILFIDVVDNVEKIGDHLTNIAQGIVGGLYWDGIEP